MQAVGPVVSAQAPIRRFLPLTTTEAKPPGRLGNDFGLRLVSGLVLAVAAIGLTWGGVLPFGMLVLAVTLIVSWEWGHIVRKAGIDTIFVVQAIVISVATALAIWELPALGVVVVVVGAILAALLGFGQLGRI